MLIFHSILKPTKISKYENQVAFIELVRASNYTQQLF